MISIAIKKATKKAHLDLEKKVIRKLKAISNEQDYADFLSYFYAYFSHLEKAIGPFITDTLIPNYKKRRNSGYLKRDLEAIGCGNNSLPATTVPIIDNYLKALGALYVMEGSVMGGQIIVKILEKQGITKGVSFFSGYGDDTEKMWITFTKAMDEHITDERQKKKVIRAAKETFSCFSTVFDQEHKILQNARPISSLNS